MKTKAIHNIKAAEALIDKAEEGYYTASIHHVYYAVFQYMKYDLAHTDMEPLSYEEQTVKAKEHRMGSHDLSSRRSIGGSVVWRTRIRLRISLSMCVN